MKMTEKTFENSRFHDKLYVLCAVLGKLRIIIYIIMMGSLGAPPRSRQNFNNFITRLIAKFMNFKKLTTILRKILQKEDMSREGFIVLEWSGS